MKKLSHYIVHFAGIAITNSRERQPMLAFDILFAYNFAGIQQYEVLQSIVRMQDRLG